MENFPNEMSKPTSFTTANPQILMTVRITQPAKLTSAQGSSSPRDYTSISVCLLLSYVEEPQRKQVSAHLFPSEGFQYTTQS